MRRLGLVMTATAVQMIAACGAPPGVPEWKEGMPAPAAPSASGSVPARDQPAAVAAPSPATTTAAPPAAPDVAVSSPPDAASGERFLAAVHGRLPEVAVDRRPEEITEMGDAACVAMATGQRRAAAATELTGYGVSGAEARELVTLARTFLCRT